MKKADLIDMVRDTLGGTKVQATEIVQMIFDAMAKEMAKGGTFEIAGFGKFEGKKKEARTGRNPKTGETLEIAAKKVPAFKAAKALKDLVAETR